MTTPSASASEIESELATFLNDLIEEFPGFRIVPKSKSRLSRAIDWLLRVVTLNGQQSFMSVYHTVIGSTLYVPAAWPSTSAIDKLILLRHERVHLRQRRRLGFATMAFVYLVPFFPLGLAYGRARLEWEAYQETLRATAELRGLEAVLAPALRAKIVSRFTGPDYGWMWPFRATVECWYDSCVEQIQAHASLRVSHPHPDRPLNRHKKQADDRSEWERSP